MKEQVLAALRRQEGRFVSGRALSETLGVTRAAVWKDIRRLQAMGYGIDTDPKEGYRLAASPDLLTREELLPGPATAVLGQKLLHFATLGSTNAKARALAEAGEPEGTAVVAEEQSAGRGRAGRQWYSSAGKGIWLSLILRPQTPLASLPCLTMAACAAAGTALERAANGIRVKWPNDLLLEGRKLGGVLTEISGEADRIDYAILGIGLNVNQETADFPPIPSNDAISLRMATHREQSRQALLCDLLAAFEPLYDTYRKTGRCEEALRFCRAHSCVTGRRILLKQDGGDIPAFAVELEPDGGLRVRYDDGTEDIIPAGGVSLRLPAPC